MWEVLPFQSVKWSGNHNQDRISIANQKPLCNVLLLILKIIWSYPMLLLLTFYWQKWKDRINEAHIIPTTFVIAGFLHTLLGLIDYVPLGLSIFYLLRIWNLGMGELMSCLSDNLTYFLSLRPIFCHNHFKFSARFLLFLKYSQKFTLLVSVSTFISKSFPKNNNQFMVVQFFETHSNSCLASLSNIFDGSNEEMLNSNTN